MGTLEHIPSAEEFPFKEAFIKRYSELTNWEEFKKYSHSYLRRSIRINTLKGSVVEIQKSIEAKGWKLLPIPWCKEGFWISHQDRRDVGNLLEHKFGKIYVQGAASMLPPIVLAPKPGDIVLDMCAAPGSKTTQIAAMMKNEGLLVANDYRGMRIQSLGINLQRSGITNVLVTLMDGGRFKNMQFDKILLDAPCSGTGTIRKSLKTITIWNPGMVKKIALEQKRLAENAFKNLKPGGVLVYSTCSLEPEEDEGVVTHLLETFPDAKLEQIIMPGLKKNSAIVEFAGKKYHKDIQKTLRVWPQDADTQGFYVAKIIKNR